MNRSQEWQLGDRSLDLSSARLMGILNVTPDSFSDGGQYLEPTDALRRAQELIDQGADIIDIGGESTRPGSERVDAPEQIRRVIPVIRAIREAGINAPISIDTTRIEVAQAAIDAGASIINDIAAGTESEEMLSLAADTGAGLVLMHRLLATDAPRERSVYPSDPEYARGVVETVMEYLTARVHAAKAAGVKPECIATDPGLGFGKSVEQNYELIARTGQLLSIGHPVLSAASRKSFIGAATGIERAKERVPGSIAVSVAHFRMGVRLFRVHDLAEHRQALAVAAAIGVGE